MADAPLSSLRRHDSFYFFDGNICLLSHGVVFRVFKSLLAAESEVFRDMFTFVSEGLDGQDLYDGVPLINVDDDPKDLSNLFQFLWKPQLTEPAFDTICSCIRISTKYVIDPVLKWSLERLESTIPCEYKDFQTAQTHYQKHPSHAAKVIALARKCDLPQYLPPAFYFLACGGDEHAIPVHGSYALSADDVRRILLGKTTIPRYWWNFVTKSDDLGLNESTHYCHNREAVNIRAIRSALEAGARDPMQHWMSNKAVYGNACSTCKKGHATLCEDYGKRLFNTLPHIFNLDRKIKRLPTTRRRNNNQSA